MSVPMESIETPITLHPVDGVLEAEFGIQTPLSLAAGDVAEKYGGGGPLCLFPSVPFRHRVK